MATQKTMESGPIDAVTNDAKYTLSEEKLLKNWSSQEGDSEDLKFEAKLLVRCFVYRFILYSENNTYKFFNVV